MYVVPEEKGKGLVVVMIEIDQFLPFPATTTAALVYDGFPN